MPGKKFNTLDGRRWIINSVSVWNIVKTAEENKLGHPAMFPEELCNRLIEVFTFPGDSVLDPFSGVGSTLVAAKHLARNAWGFEINPNYVEIARKRLTRAIWGSKLAARGSSGAHILKFEGKAVKLEQSTEINTPPPPETKIEVVQETAYKLPDRLTPDSIDFVLTSPPYWDILRQKRTADYKESRPYSDDNQDLGNIESYGEFITHLGKIFKNVYGIMKPGKFCAVIVMDIRKKDKFYPFHSDLATEIVKQGFELEDIIIWNRAQEYNNLRALGYPYLFRVNKIHEYILLFSKRVKSKE